jgi:glycyl-tRNA synthetase beta chain
LQQDEEKTLSAELAKAVEAAGSALETEAYGDAMAAIAVLRRPVDAFFDEVTVNADDADTRANRLRLLSQIRSTLNQVADFSQIEG